MSQSLTAWHIGAIFIVIGVSFVAVQAADSYCYKFTWLGSGYDNDSLSDVGNKSCTEMRLQQPCVEPLVVTYDGSEPDTDLIWEMYDRDEITCKLTRNTVCLKWVTFYDGIVENITYTCGRMTGPSGSEQDKCETMKSGTYMTTACACRTAVVNGEPRVPCNTSTRATVNVWTYLFVVTSALLALCGKKLH